MQGALKERATGVEAAFHIDGIAEFIAFLAERGVATYCDHGRLWARCWCGGHLAEFRDDVQLIDELENYDGFAHGFRPPIARA
jgi:hypothetical protein